MAKQRSYDAVIAAPFGRLGITLRDGLLADIDFLDGARPLRAPRTAAARNICRKLHAYLRNPRLRFNLSLAIDGTDFQQRVWNALRRIPAGKVLSYGKLARQLKTGPRAVGNACRANPIPVVIPCHRVVAANGRGGFMGKTGGKALAIKDWLLTHERGR
ncbi:MAG: methylated-DNA--[protein]-cysteine S-methyltransferase [Pseudomonadota bacterium]